MPTLYNGSNTDPMRPRPKPSIIEMVLYNMAAMLASFAAGYDVRLSNVTPFHPCLHPERYDDVRKEQQCWVSGPDSGFIRSGYVIPESEFSSSPGYPHNTYHGPVRHYRSLLNNLVMPRQIDSSYVPNLVSEEDIRPLHSQLSALKLTHSGSQSGSRTVSCSSSRAGSPCRKSSYITESSEVLPHSILSSPYLHNRTVSTSEKPHFVAMQYQPGIDVQQVDNTSINSLQRYPINDSRSSPLHYNLGLGYESDVEQYSGFVGHGGDILNAHHPMFENSRSVIGNAAGGTSALSNVTFTPPLSRTPSRLSSGFMHKQNISSGSNMSNTSNISLNLGIDEEAAGRPMHSTSTPHSEWSNDFSPTIKFYHQNSRELIERDTSLFHRPATTDSLTSEDSSYVSAKEGSYSSSSVSRVRFSPISSLMASSSGVWSGGTESGLYDISSFNNTHNSTESHHGNLSSLGEKEPIGDFNSTRLRSSLKRLNYSPIVVRSGLKETAILPVDQITSHGSASGSRNEDASLFSPKDASMSRVRFSPVSSTHLGSVCGFTESPPDIKGQTSKDGYMSVQGIPRAFTKHRRDSSLPRQSSNESHREFLS